MEEEEEEKKEGFVTTGFEESEGCNRLDRGEGGEGGYGRYTVRLVVVGEEVGGGGVT